MFKALAVKELRESAGLIVLAILAWLFFLYVWSPAYGYGGYPFVNDEFGIRFTLIMGALAIALGFRQSAREANQNTYQFLLHMPASRRFLFGAKLFVGGGLVLVLGGLAAFAYALWAATPGHSPTPFFWSMTTSTWLLALSMMLVYLGAFLSGIRPGRWFGTRLAPVLAAVFAAFALSFLSWWVAAASMLIVAALAVASIFYCAHARDY